jgi:hypothetical protein
MKMSVMKFVVALATALTLTAVATVSFAQSRSCIPQYDSSARKGRRTATIPGATDKRARLGLVLSF